MVLTKDSIIQMLISNNKAVGRALIVLNDRQTSDEQYNQSTNRNNGRGFTPADARMGTSMANFFTKFNRLSDKQLAYWRKPNVRGVPRIAKYAGQLLEIAQMKQIEKTTAPKVSEDLGNLLEEQMALQERIDAFKLEIELYRDSDDMEGIAQMELHLDSLFDAMISLNERIEEVKRCEFKMNR
jgi:hypothetical protein